MTRELLDRIHEIQNAISSLQVSEAHRSELRGHLDAIELELRTENPSLSNVQTRLTPFQEVVHEVNEIEHTALEANAAKNKIFEWLSSVTYALGFR